MGGLSSLWQDTWDNVSDWAKDIEDFVFHGGFEDDLREAGRWFDDEVWEPVYEFQKDVVNGILDDPIKFVAEAVLISTGQGWAIPLMNGAAVIDAGGDWEDVLKSIAVGYSAQYLGTKTAGFVDAKYAEYVPDKYYNDVVAASLVEGTERGVNALVLGESGTDAFVGGVLSVSTEELAGIALGEIDERIGLAFKDLEGKNYPLPQAAINVISAGLTAELQGEEITPALYAEAVSKALITTEAVSSVLGKVPEVITGDISDRQLSFLTTSIQRTATVALAGGTGDDAARVLLETIKGFGAEELNKAIEDSLLGDVLDNALDVLTGDFGAVSDTIDALGNLWTGSIEGLQNQATAIADNLDEYGRKYNISLDNYQTDRIITGSGDNVSAYSYADIAEKGNTENWSFVRDTGSGTGITSTGNQIVFGDSNTGMDFTTAMFESKKDELRRGGNSYYDKESRVANDAALFTSYYIDNQIVGTDRGWWTRTRSDTDFGGQWYYHNNKSGDGRQTMLEDDWLAAQDFYENRSIGALSEDLNETYGDYNGYLEDNRVTLEDLNAQLAPLYEQWDQLNLDLTDYLADLETSSEEVNTNFSPINDEISEIFVTAMDPNFVLGEYAEINNIPPEDGYDHYLSMGSKAGLATNNAAAAAMEEKEVFDTAAQILGEITVYADKPSNNNTIMFSQAYSDLIKGKEGQPAVPKEVVAAFVRAPKISELDDILATGDRNAIANYYANAYAKERADKVIEDTANNFWREYEGPLTEEQHARMIRDERYDSLFEASRQQWISQNFYRTFTIPDSNDNEAWDLSAQYSDGINDEGSIAAAGGFDRYEALHRNGEVLEYSDTIAADNPNVDFTNLDRAANEDFSASTTVLGGDTSWSDVIAGNADKRFNVVTNEFEWVKKAEDAAPVTIWDANKGIVPINTGATDFVTLRSEDPIDFVNNLIEMNEVIITAEREEINAAFTANGMAGYLDMAMWIGAKREELEQSVLDAIPGSQERKDAFEDDVANLVEWGAGLVNTVNGVQRFIGMDVNPEVTEWAKKWQKLGAEMHTQGYKDARAENDALMSAPIPEGMGYAEGTARKILGTLENRPSVFLTDMIGQEVFQEGLPWLLGAGAAVVAAPVVGAAGLSAAAGAAIIAGVGLTTALGSEVLLAMSETFDGAYEKVYKESVAELSKQTYTTYINDKAVQLPMYQPAEIEELSRKMADDLAFKNSLTAGVLTTISMGFGGAKLEKFLFGDKGNASFTSAAEELMDRVDNGVDVIVGEAVSETVEETLTTAHLGSMIVSNVNKEYDVAPDVWMAAFLSPIISAGTTGTIYTLGQGPLSGNYQQGVDEELKDAFNGTTTNESVDPNTHLLLNSSPQINWQFNNTPKTVEGAQQFELFLDDVGVEGTTAVNLLNEVYDSGYQSSAEVVEEFAKAGYTPTIEEITQFTSARGAQNRIEYAIPQYVEPFVITAEDLVQAAASQGVTITADQASEMNQYLGQYVEDDKATAITARAVDVADISVLDIDEVSGWLQSRGWTKEQADAYVATNGTAIVDSMVGKTEAEVDTAFGQEADEVVVTREEAEAFYAEYFPDYEFTQEDIDAIVTGTDVTWNTQLGEQAAIDAIKAQKDAANEPPKTPEELAREEKIALLDASNIPQGSRGYNDIVKGIYGLNTYGGTLEEPFTLDRVQSEIDNKILTREELEDALHNDFDVPRDTESMDAAVEAALEAGLTLGYQPRSGEVAFGYQQGDAYTNQLAASNVYDYIEGLRTARAKDLTSAAGVPYNSSLRDLSLEELTTYIDRKAQQIDAEETDARTLDRYEAEGILINNLGIPNVIPDPDGEGNIRNPELDRLIDTYFGDAGLLGVDDTVSANDRLQQGYEAAKEAHDAARVKFMEDNYGITPTPEQLERLRSATDTQWINDDEILQARRDLAAANNEKTLSPQELSRYLSDLGLSYNDDDGIYKAILGMGFTGEGGATFDADQRAAIAAEVNTLKAAYDAEQAAEAAAAAAAKKRQDTITAFGDYGPNEAEIAQFLDNNAGIAQYVDDNTITQAEVKQSLEDQGFVVPEGFDYTQYTGKKPQANLDTATKAWRDANTVTETEVKLALEAEGFTVPDDFNYDAFTGKNKPDTGIKGQVDTYLEPRQYTRAEAKADLAAELGISVSAIDEEVYGTYLDQIVQLNGDTNADATGKTQVQSDITNVDDVRSYLQGLDYDTTGLTNEELLAFAGTGLNVDLGTVTSDYQTANETITQRDARLAAEAELAAKAAEINAAMDDPNQDGGAFSGGAYDDIRNYYLYNPEGKAQYDALNTEDRKALVQRAVDNRRYSENEVAYDIRTAFPADADLSVEDLKTKYPTLFNLVGDGTYNHQERQEVAFDEGTITGDEARDALEATGFVIPEGFDFTNFTGVMDETQLGTQISTDLAPLQYTRADAQAALAAELGRSLTAEDLTTYKDYLDGLVDMTGETTNAIGDAKVQSDITNEQDVRDYLSDYTLGEDFSFDGLTGLGVDLDDALGDFKANNRTTAQNQIAADLGTKGWADASDADIAAVENLDSAERAAWVADRQFTRDQAVAALAAQGIDANHPQFESLVTQLVVDKGAAGTPTTQGALVDDPEDALIDQFITTQAEVDAAFGNYGYFDPTDANIPTGVIDDSTLSGLVETYVDDNYVSADEARAALDGIAGIDALAVDDNGDYVITDDQLVGMGLVGQYDPTNLTTNVDAATTTEEEVRDAFGDTYNPTDAEIARYVGLLPDGDLGTDIPAYVAGRMDTLVSDVGDLSLTVSQLEAQLNGALAEGGSLDQAVSKVASDLNIAEDALLKLIGDNSTKFDDLAAAFGTQATGDQEATGIWANIADLEGDVSDLQDAFGTPATDDEAATGIYGIIDQVAEGVLSNDEALELLEDVIGNPAVADNPLTTDIDESSPATGIYAQSGEGVNAEVQAAIDAVYDYVGNAGFASGATLEQVAAAVGKPAQEVTQADIDAVNQIIGNYGNAPWEGGADYTDTELAYDVNADGRIDQTDIDLLTAVQSGDYGVYGGELATDSLFANTGFYDIFDQNRYTQEQAAIEAERKRQEDLDTQNEINTNIQATINAQIAAEEARAAEEEQRRLAGQLQAMGRGRVTTPDVAQIDYLYDVYGDSPFATPQQESLYRSPYSTGANDEQQPQLPLKAAAEGGLIEDETDELMKLLGI